MQMGEKTGNKFVSETAAAAGIHKKRHLVITGSRGIGKSTLLREILALPYFSDLDHFRIYNAGVSARPCGIDR